MEFEILSPERASLAFTSHHSDVDIDCTSVFEKGQLEAYTATYETTFDSNWADLHQVHTRGNESFQHLRLKLVLAEFIRDLGHDIGVELPERQKRPHHKFDREYIHNQFEQSYSNGRADVYHFSDDGHLIGEVGDCSARKLLRSGLHVDGSAFLLLPYGWSSGETEFELLDGHDEAIGNQIEDYERTVYDISARIAIYIKPETDLVEALYPGS